MLDYKTLQRNMADAGFYKMPITGVWEAVSIKAQNDWLRAARVDYFAWSEERRFIALNQLVLKRNGFDPHGIDGLNGDGTKEALRAYQIKHREADPDPVEVKHITPIWPRQADVEKVFGKPGTNHTVIILPYPFRLAWNKTTKITRLTINAKCADSLVRVLNKVLNHYGLEKIQELGLDIFGGCFNDRAMRGGARKSMHAYAIALDFDPERNQLRWGRDKAQMAKPEYKAFIDAFESEGWVSLGHERNFDWMHFQAARL